MDGDQFAHLFGSGGTGVGGGLYGTHVAPNHDGHKTATYLLLAYQLHICGLDHGVSSFNGPNEAFGFDHT
jgi:hypothetical protein